MEIVKKFRRYSGRGLQVGLHAGRGRAPLPPNRVQAYSSRALRVALIIPSPKHLTASPPDSWSTFAYWLFAMNLRACLPAFRYLPTHPVADVSCTLQQCALLTKSSDAHYALFSAESWLVNSSTKRRDGRGPDERDVHPTSARFSGSTRYRIEVAPRNEIYYKC